jgi:hypothetical protein
MGRSTKIEKAVREETKEDVEELEPAQGFKNLFKEAFILKP